ncbi:MAG: 2,3-bisphosphoglycerate-independent phosphoglycerate mutase [Elusimicrobia bacterium]|nr:2,3-bisphosphoglycerate-independent phosphoglycerate mutase [Elusimicrobiota bacterium]
MDNLALMESISQKNEQKILLVVMDGLGGLSNPATGKTELETANIPNLDKLANRSACGLSIPVAYGITPGSGPAHLSLFGYDPLKYQIGRGVLEALGIGMELGKNDLCARANFATMDYSTGKVIDRRAGRLPTEKNKELCAKISSKIKKTGDVEIIIRPAKGHRFVVVFRGDGLSENVTENDPQKENNPPNKIQAGSVSKSSAGEGLPDAAADAKKTAGLLNAFLTQVQEIIKNEKPANYILMRGFSKYPDIPQMGQAYKLNPAAIATYPMYKGLAQLVGMKILNAGETLSSEIETLKREYANHDFFYFHIKDTDAMGEDGNFDGKVKKFEEIDRYIPELLSLKPDVMIITGDHSTPAVIKGHSWHPVPFMLMSKWTAGGEVSRFTERECLRGSLGTFHATSAMSLAMAHSLKLAKFGA